MRVTRRYKFVASHRLHSPRLSEAENREVYGKCNYPHGHGHNYVLEVGVKGPLDPRTGLVVNTAALDRLVRENVIEAFDHKNLNLDVPVFARLVPTTENLAAETQRRLAGRWSDAFPGPSPALASVRIYETRRNIVELSSSS